MATNIRSIYYVDNAVIIRAKETDDWGSPVPGDPTRVPVKCKLTFENKMVTNVSGNDVVSTTIV